MQKIKNICILGSTGSIGQNSLNVIASFPDRFKIAYLINNRNIESLQNQIRRFKPKGVGVIDLTAAKKLKSSLNGEIPIYEGIEKVTKLVSNDDVDIVISSLVGFAGLKPTLEAIKHGKTIALANKETLVVAGEIITQMVKQHNATLIPIDSEHSAIFQCLVGENPKNISRLILTASGGPFLKFTKEQLSNVTVEDALNHPKWKMGSKITIDSATLMNKGLEVIEAHWFFNLPPEKIEVVIHPQSIIHSMVEFVDGSIKAQLGVPDMKIPIQYALTYPERISSEYERIKFAHIKEMTFFEPDMEKFECLSLAYRVLELGGTAPAILNAANEIAVNLFLESKIKFLDIPRLIRHALETIPITQHPSLEEIIQADSHTRDFVLSSYVNILEN